MIRKPSMAGNGIPLRTLIVEDNVQFRRSFREILENQFPEMVIFEAGDGKEAFETIAASQPHLVFMDIRLPGENGLELTKKIKTQDPRIVVIVLTSYDLPEYREVAKEYGANHFLVKGLTTGDEIAAVVRSLFSGGQAPRC
jgi:DNA-binding NarL/FixJ family response regulator